jgi:hypothetical protein
MDNENLRTVYEQFWNHARHVATERMQFTRIYAIIVAATLGFLSVSKFNILHIWLASFLLILSLIGLFACHSLTIHFITYSRLTEIILVNEWKLPYRQFFPTSGSRLISKVGSLNVAFYSVYILGSMLSSALLSYYFWQSTLYCVLAGIVMFTVLFTFMKFYLRRVEKQIEREIKKKISEHIA